MSLLSTEHTMDLLTNHARDLSYGADWLFHPIPATIARHGLTFSDHMRPSDSL